MKGSVTLALAGAMLMLATPAAARDCGMYPPAVGKQDYMGWSDCVLRKYGEKPLWHGLTDKKLRQQIRFTFTEGHGDYTRVINFAERADGTGTISLRTIYPRTTMGPIISRRARYRVSAEDVAAINRLGVESGNWDMDLGTWDASGEEDGEPVMYIHCQTLDMERIDATGYRFSSVNIGCNQPKKLMPLVRLLTGLVKLKPSANGRLF